MKRTIVFFLTLLLVLTLSACGASQPETEMADGPAWASLEQTGNMPLTHAKEFSVDYYGNYSLVTIEGDNARFLVVPEDSPVPSGLDAGIVPLRQPLENIYLVSSAAMDMFVSCHGLDSIRFSGLQQDGWYIEPAREAMEAGDILYTGKYSAPDYERICAEGCSLAVENTMIYHSPQVKEQLEQLGIPVLVDRSSYETSPQGRMEWCRLYGLLTGHQKEADEAFQTQVQAFDALEGLPSEGQKVAFFYVNTNGAAVVRRGNDYVSRMIEMAGGSYLFPDLTGDADSHTSTATIQMEEFYLAAKEADYLIYNSTIDGQLYSLQDFLDKNQLFANLKAVQEGHVYCTAADLYQSSMGLGTFVTDLHRMLCGETDGLTYLYRLE